MIHFIRIKFFIGVFSITTRSNIVERYRFEFIEPHERSVFPIFQRSQQGISRIAGTGFFIAPLGIFASAAHVFEIEVEENDSFWCIFIDENQEIQELEFQEIHIRPEERDLAIGQIQMRGAIHPIVSLMELEPVVDEILGTFAFSHTEVQEPYSLNEEEYQEISYRSHWEIGKAEEIYEHGYYQVPGLAFRSSILVEGRASGGPVFNSNGFVIGVNSRSMAPPNEIPYSIASSLNGLQDLLFNDISINDRRMEVENRPNTRIYRLSQ